MATLYVAEFPTGVVGSMQVAAAPPLNEQTIAIGAGSVQSTAFKPSTGYVRVVSDTVCSIAFGVNPTATATTMRLAAGAVEYFSVQPGHKVAVITNT